MEAKEIKELIEKARNRNGDGLVDHKYLAEISFATGKQEGIREVVEEIEKFYTNNPDGLIHLIMTYPELQAFLKSKGIRK